MSEPLCQCGHGKRQHAACKWECYYCQCAEFAPRKRETESGGRIDTFDDPYANARTEAPPARSRDDEELAALRADREILNELTALADVWREYSERPDCADSLTYRAASDWIMHILAGNSHAALPYFLGDALDESEDA